MNKPFNIVNVLIILLFIFNSNLKANNFESPVTLRYQVYKKAFGDVYNRYPNVPRGVLEAVSYNYTRFFHLTDQQGESCLGVPKAYTIMGLTADGKGYFRSNFKKVSELSGFTKEEMLSSPGISIEAYAKAYEELLVQLKITSSRIEDQVNVLINLFELPEGKNLEQDFATSSNLYSILWFLNDKEMQSRYSLPQRTIDMESVFGKETLAFLSSKEINISNDKVVNELGTQYKGMEKSMCQNYWPAILDEADTSNYSSRNGYAIDAFTIHDIQGTYAAAIAWFNNPSANVSTHYVIRNFDGQVTQMVCESDKAWHVTTSNPWTVGTEHEGYWNVPGWYTEAMYQVSADVVGKTLDNNGIDRKRAYDGPGHSGPNQLSNCYKVKGHQHFPNSSSRSDPGVYWDWAYFYTLLNPTFNLTGTYTNASGTIYDDGGSTANYSSDDRKFWLIQPSGASSVTLSFTTFELENNFDFLYIYNGTSNTDPLIGRYTSTNSPGTIVGTSGALLLELRSDCNTTMAGWEANWTSNQSASSCGVPGNLVVSNETAFTAQLDWNAVLGADSYVIKYRHMMHDTNWTYASANTSSHILTSLSSNGQHEVYVAALCSSDTSAFIGAVFGTQPASGHVTVDACSGSFRDAGGSIDYSNNEDYLFTIAPTGATNVSVVFNSFNTELNYDYLYAYNGIDDNAPSLGTFHGSNNPGTVTSTNGGLTFKFHSDQSTVAVGWEAVWYAYGGSCPPAPITEISNTNNWVSSDFTANFIDTDNSNTGIKDKFYQVINYNGVAWEANTSNGFLFDDFENGLNPNWVNYSGNWSVNNGVLIQSDESNVNTNLYIPIEQDSNYTYLYNWKMKIEGSAGTKRAGVHIFSDAPTGVERGNSYLTWIRTDGNFVQIWDNVNNADTKATEETYVNAIGTWIDYKWIYNPSNGEQSLYIDDVLISTYSDNTPHKTGQYLSLRTRYCIGYFDDIKVFKSRNNTELISIGNNVDKDIRYQNQTPSASAGLINTVVRDNNQHISVEENYIVNVDWTNPADVAWVNDGVGSDIDTTNSSIRANWNLSSDNNSGIQKYWYSIGTTPGGNDVIDWTNNGLATSLNLLNTGQFNFGQVYYTSVKAENLAGLFSNVSSSDGQILLQQQSVSALFEASIDTICPGTNVSFTNMSSGASQYEWTFSGANISVSNDENPVVNFVSPGVQTVSLVASDGSQSDNYSVDIFVAPIPNQPNISTNGSGATCGYDSVMLYTGGFDSYLWSNGELGSSIWVNASGQYSVVVSNSFGCTNESDPININLSSIVAPDICIVGVDSTGNHTQLVWEKPLNEAIDSIYVYRENAIANQFEFLASVDYNDFSIYIDEEANPTQQAYRYKLAAKDTCGGISLMSDFHKTIHLTINQGVGTSWNLIWNHYEGFGYSTYNIYRGSNNNNLSLLTSIAGNLDSFTDLNPPVGNVYYQLEVVKAASCSPTKSSFSGSRSNIVSYGTASSITSHELGEIVMYPNPSKENVQLQFVGNKYDGELTVRIYNTIGQVVYNKVENLDEYNQLLKVDLGDIVRGVYFIEVSSESYKWSSKLVKE